jgi:hypothetical protein
LRFDYSHAIIVGLPASSIPEFITDLVAQNSTALLLVPGISPEIIGAGAGALLDTYAASFKNVWITAVTFVALAAIGKSQLRELLTSRLMNINNQQSLSSCSTPAKSSTIILMHRWRRKSNCMLENSIPWMLPG